MCFSSDMNKRQRQVKKWLVLVGGYCLVTLSMSVSAQTDTAFELIPKAPNENYAEAVDDLWSNKKQDFWNKYQYFADSWSNKKDVGSQLASGIMNRDTIFLLLARIATVLSNMALVIWSAMIIYAGYLYVVSVYAGDNASKANGAIKRAIIGIVVVVFSYAIIKILTSAFLS